MLRAPAGEASNSGCWLLQDSIAAQGEFAELQVRVLADGKAIWFSPRSVLSGGQQYEHEIDVQWFALHVHVFFDRTIESTDMTQEEDQEQEQEQANPRGGHWSAAYGAQLLVYKTSIRDILAAGPVLLDNNGVAVLSSTRTL